MSTEADANGWRPIETMPKIDTTIEAPTSHREGVAVAFDDDTGESLFLVYYRHMRGRGYSKLTHWQPLPEPPKDTP